MLGKQATGYKAERQYSFVNSFAGIHTGVHNVLQKLHKVAWESESLGSLVVNNKGRGSEGMVNLLGLEVSCTSFRSAQSPYFFVALARPKMTKGLGRLAIEVARIETSARLVAIDLEAATSIEMVVS